MEGGRKHLAQAVRGPISAVASVRVSGLEGDAIDLGAARLSKLASRLRGRVLHEFDAGFDQSVAVWNGMVTKRPALVVQPLTAGDVRETVSFAREHGVLLSVKGGGHHVAGIAIAEGGLMLDMSLMRQVRVDPDRRLAHVQAGCRLDDVDGATQAYGLATVLGADAHSGVAGLALGGGHGWLTRRFGWTVDNLAEVEIVSADGRLRRAAEDENEDLFWAVRGGGGNFGVVTRFSFRLHEVGPLVTAGVMIWEAAHAQAVLDVYRRVTEQAPHELSVALTLRLAPYVERIPEPLRGRPVIGIVACHSGDPRDAGRLLAPFRDIPAAIDAVTRRAYVDHQFAFGFPQPAGCQQYWKSEFLQQLSGRCLEALQRCSAGQTSSLSQLAVVQLGGAIADRADDATAMGNRDAEYILLASGTWHTDDPDGYRHLGWVRSTWEALRTYSTGGNYVNAHNADDGEERTKEAYRGAYTRLTAVKAAHDPDNFFRVNRNIRPAREADLRP